MTWHLDYSVGGGIRFCLDFFIYFLFYRVLWLLCRPCPEQPGFSCQIRQTKHKDETPTAADDERTWSPKSFDIVSVHGDEEVKAKEYAVRIFVRTCISWYWLREFGIRTMERSMHFVCTIMNTYCIVLSNKVWLNNVYCIWLLYLQNPHVPFIQDKMKPWQVYTTWICITPQRVVVKPEG